VLRDGRLRLTKAIQRCSRGFAADELERVDLRKMNLQLVANKENQHRAQNGKNEAAGWYRSFVGRENMWVTPPPRIDPMMPRTIVQKIVMCTCIRLS
jgi:hypothetical protein